MSNAESTLTKIVPKRRRCERSDTGSLLTTILSKDSITTPIDKIIGIDPADTREEFLEQIRPFGVSTRFYQTSLDAFFQQKQSMFDVILASQCLYSSENLMSDLLSTHNHGRAACIVFRSDIGIYQIQLGLQQYLGNKKEKSHKTALLTREQIMALNL
jgi:hypothetical protein